MPGLGYDDQGGLAAYFGITFLSLLLLPWTFINLRTGLFGHPEKQKDRQRECACEECTKKAEAMRRWERDEKSWTRRIGLTWTNTLLVLGWIAFAALLYTISQAPSTASSVYDPFEILGLSSSTDEKGIKRHFKRLSLKFHPDKIKLGVNETIANAEAKFVELTKAYKSLTDETIRENLARYGNPDGQQPREEKIAIPQWVIEGSHGYLALAAYAALLGLGLPWLVGSWWFSQKSITKDGALNDTAELFFKELKEDIKFPQLIGLVASAFEFRTLLGVASAKKIEKGLTKKDRRARSIQTDELEKTVTAKADSLDLGMGPVLVSLPTAPAKRAAALIWSHLLRIDDLSPDLLEERRQVLNIIPSILPSLLNMALAYHWLSTSSLIMSLSARLVQASPNDDIPLVQLPGVDIDWANKLSIDIPELQEDGWQDKVTEVLQTSSTTSVADVKSKLSEKAETETETEAVEELKNLTERSKEMMKQIPRLHVTEANFSVEGEDQVTPGSLIQFTYNVYLSRDSNSPSVPSISVSKNAASKDTPTTRSQPHSSAQMEVPDVYAHAPRWPGHRKPHWWVMIGDPTQNKVIVQPQRITDIPMQSPEAIREGEKPRVKTYKLAFQAPPSASVHQFEAYWISDSYLKCGVVKKVTLQVEDLKPEAFVDDEEDDISDPEEDTIEGQLAAMRGGKVKKSRTSARDDDHDHDHDEEDHEHDEESGSDGERRYGDEEDTDTSDSEDENERRDKRKEGGGGDDTSSDSDSD